jgi:hypothetical protein
MNRTLGLAACLAALAILSLAAAGCGDDDDNGSGTPGADSTAPTSVNITPFPTGMVTNGQIASESKGYSATIPADWRPRFNQIQTVDGSADAFFEPLAPDAVVQANIAVTCLTDRRFSTEDRINAAKTTTSRLGLNTDIEASERQVDGVTATVLTYSQTSQQNPDQPTLAKQDIMFAGEKCEYTITTVSEIEDRAKYQATFDAFVDSFKFDK